MAVIKLLLCLCLVHAAIAKGSMSQVECTSEVMKITVPMDGDRRISYLDQLKAYKPCQPELNGKTAMFVLDLQDPHKCGVTRVLHKKSGKRTFYHKVVIEDSAGGRETVSARCVVLGKQRISRDIHPFPLDFDEPEVLNITFTEEGKAPEPVLGAIVKQNGKQVSGEISVTPGTPLTMEIFLNEESAPIYGLLVNYMHVTDTGKQQETIILNGCSVDPYLFDNFVTTDGDTLTAKFKAFKFPDTTYVQFKGTVTVCLDKCTGAQCSNGQFAYGRRRRSIASSESNKVYEVSLTTFIKVDYENGDKEAALYGFGFQQAGMIDAFIMTAIACLWSGPIHFYCGRAQEDVLAILRNLRVANQRLGDMDGTAATVAEHTSNNKLVLVAPQGPVPDKSNMAVASCLLVMASLLLLLK